MTKEELLSFAERLVAADMERVTKHPEYQAAVLQILITGKPPPIEEETLKRWLRETMDS